MGKGKEHQPQNPRAILFFSFFLFKKDLFYKHRLLTCMYTCTEYVCLVPIEDRRGTGSSGTTLWALVNNHVDAGDQAWVPTKENAVNATSPALSP